MALNLDPKHGQNAAEAIVTVLNGRAQEVIAEGFQVAQSMGEDNPAVEAGVRLFKEYEQFFNEQFMPAANKIKDNCMGYAELADHFNKLDFAGVAAPEEVGTVADANYDAAKDL